FQAEDGIRDGHVTGVQTCALPISICADKGHSQTECERRAKMTWAQRLKRVFNIDQNPPPNVVAKRINVLNIKDYFQNLFESSTRSEERRVGKECRSRCIRN